MLRWGKDTPYFFDFGHQAGNSPEPLVRGKAAARPVSIHANSQTLVSFFTVLTKALYSKVFLVYTKVAKVVFFCPRANCGE